MFDNIGKKIKSFALLVGCLGAVGSIFYTISIFSADRYNSDNIYLGTAALLIGLLLSFTSCYLIYGFGELIEQTTSINAKLSAERTYPDSCNTPTQSALQDRVTIVTSSTSAPFKNQSDEDKTLSDGGWKCPECGKVNFKYNSRCECGTKKPLMPNS